MLNYTFRSWNLGKYYWTVASGMHNTTEWRKLEISKGWQSLLLKRAKCMDNWKMPFVPVVDTAWSTVFVTRGDVNDVQSELILADCLCMAWLLTQTPVRKQKKEACEWMHCCLHWGDSPFIFSCFSQVGVEEVRWKILKSIYVTNRQAFFKLKNN